MNNAKATSVFLVAPGVLKPQWETGLNVGRTSVQLQFILAFSRSLHLSYTIFGGY